MKCNWRMCAKQYSLTMDCTTLVKLSSLRWVVGSAGNPISSRTGFVSTLAGAATADSSSGSAGTVKTMLEYISEDQTFWKALNSKVAPFLPKVGRLPLGTELLEVLPIIQNTVYIVPLWSMFCRQCHMHICGSNHLHANLEVTLFTLISGKHKWPNSTCLVQLALKVLYYPLPHGSSHSVWTRETDGQRYIIWYPTWIECALAALPPSIL